MSFSVSGSVLTKRDDFKSILESVALDGTIVSKNVASPQALQNMLPALNVARASEASAGRSSFGNSRQDAKKNLAG